MDFFSLNVKKGHFVLCTFSPTIDLFLERLGYLFSVLTVGLLHRAYEFIITAHSSTLTAGQKHRLEVKQEVIRVGS